MLIMTTMTTTMMVMMMMMDINSRELHKHFDVDGAPAKRFNGSGGFCIFFSLFSNCKHLLLITENEIILSRRG